MLLYKVGVLTARYSIMGKPGKFGRRLGEPFLLHFVAFFHVASLFSTGVDNEKGGVDNKKALELTNSTVFHRGRQ